MGQCRHQRGAITDRDVHRLLEDDVARLVEFALNSQDIGEKEGVDLGPLGLLGQIHPEIEFLVFPIARLRMPPDPVEVVADRVHHQQGEDHAFRHPVTFCLVLGDLDCTNV